MLLGTWRANPIWVLKPYGNKGGMSWAIRCTQFGLSALALGQTFGARCKGHGVALGLGGKGYCVNSIFHLF